MVGVLSRGFDDDGGGDYGGGIGKDEAEGKTKSTINLVFFLFSIENSLDKLPLEDRGRLAVHALEVAGVLHRWVDRKKSKKEERKAELKCRCRFLKTPPPVALPLCLAFERAARGHGAMRRACVLVCFCTWGASSSLSPSLSPVAERRTEKGKK